MASSSAKSSLRKSKNTSDCFLQISLLLLSSFLGITPSFESSVDETKVNIWIVMPLFIDSNLALLSHGGGGGAGSGLTLRFPVLRKQISIKWILRRKINCRNIATIKHLEPPQNFSYLTSPTSQAIYFHFAQISLYNLISFRRLIFHLCLCSMKDIRHKESHIYTCIPKTLKPELPIRFRLGLR